MGISCEDAAKLCTKSQYGKLSLLEVIKLNVHLFMCKMCGTFSKQNNILTKCIDKHEDHLAKNNHERLSEVEKEELEVSIKNEL